MTAMENTLKFKGEAERSTAATVLRNWAQGNEQILKFDGPTVYGIHYHVDTKTLDCNQSVVVIIHQQTWKWKRPIKSSRIAFASTGCSSQRLFLKAPLGMSSKDQVILSISEECNPSIYSIRLLLWNSTLALKALSHTELVLGTRFSLRTSHSPWRRQQRSFYPFPSFRAGLVWNDTSLALIIQFPKQEVL